MYKIKLFITLFFFSFISCDPSCDEHIKIINKSKQTLIFGLSQNHKKFHDIALPSRLNENLSIALTKSNDSLFTHIVHLPADKELVLHYDAGICDIDYFDRESAKNYINNLYDTILIKSHSLNKTLYSFENWNQNVNRKFPAFSFFEFIIEDRDLK